METLRKLYLGLLAPCVAGIVLVAPQYAFFEQRWVILTALGVAGYLIQFHVWKWVRPDLDFSGKWIGGTSYDQVHIGNGSTGGGSGQTVAIKQSCLNLRLLPESKGLDFTFKSRSIEIQDDGQQLAYSYHVIYEPGTPDRPPEAYGYEQLEVTRAGFRGRPLELKGWFAHCARGQTPVYSGTVFLVRNPGLLQRFSRWVKAKVKSNEDS